MDLSSSNGSRRSANRRSRRSAGSQYVRSERFGRHILYAMLACLGLYLLAAAVQIRRTAIYYDVVFLGSTQDEIRYSYGRPMQIFDAARSVWTDVGPATAVDRSARWAYALPSGGRLEVRFDGGRATRFTCAHPDGGSYACPPILGVKLGDLEDEIAMRIGNPTRFAIDGTTKTMWYDDIGMELKLLRFRVVAISVNADQQGLGPKIMRYFRTLVP